MKFSRHHLFGALLLGALGWLLVSPKQEEGSGPAEPELTTVPVAELVQTRPGQSEATAAHFRELARIDHEKQLVAQENREQENRRARVVAVSRNKGRAFDIFAIVLLTATALALRNAWKQRKGFKIQPTAPLPAADRFTEFVGSFRHGLESALPEAIPSDQKLSGATKKPESREQFFAGAARDLGYVRNFFTEIGRSTREADRQEMLTALVWQFNILKHRADRVELFPIWQMAFGLQGLLHQMSQDASNVTPPALETAIGAVDLLEELCDPAANLNFGEDPPVRLLGVDDDQVSRNVVATSLKKIFKAPETAADATAALALIEKHAYDLIFLDVNMPGMDGLELCSKIHEQPGNRKTPVVFVTCRSGVEAHANAICVGGQDMITKPFLTFEIGVKALTLVFRRRLLAWAAKPPMVVAPEPNQPSAELTREESAEAFFAEAPSQLQAVRSRMGELSPESTGTDRQDTIAHAYIQVDLLTSAAERAGLRSIFKLASALQVLLRKVLERPGHATESTLNTVLSSLDLLRDLCQMRREQWLTEPPIRILVVDDDLIIRRGITGVLQLAFEKPESVESGEAAVALVGEKAFDVILMDVMMPGMDGYAACSRIHETQLNARTPVVFVTAVTDRDAREKAALAGGCGFIPKPVFASEVTLAAITFAFRHRLQKPVLETPPREPNEPKLAVEAAGAGG